MTAATRVAAYLDDVARMLASIDPVDRAEILAGLREHIDAALDDERAGVAGSANDSDEAHVSDEQVRRVLAELGPPEQVAAAALSDRGPEPGQYGVPPSPRHDGVPPDSGHDGVPPGLGRDVDAVHPTSTRPSLTQSWVPVTVGLLTSLTVALYLVMLAGAVAFAVAEETVAVPPGAPSDAAPMLPASYDIVWAVLAPLPLVGLPWVVSTILLASSTLWTTAQKWAGVMLVPGTALTSGVLAWLATLVRPGATRSVLLVAAATVVAAVAIWVVVRLWREGAARARAWGVERSWHGHVGTQPQS